MYVKTVENYVKSGLKKEFTRCLSSHVCEFTNKWVTLQETFKACETDKFQHRVIETVVFSH